VMMPAREWLDVPYAQKDQAKAAGARWDPQARRWYAPRPAMASLQQWAAQPHIPDLLPGEDRSFGAGLFVDLVPSSCWFTNVRSCVDQRDWERLHRVIIGRAGRRCEVCGQGKDPNQQRWLEAHERWQFDPHRQVQTLRRLICLCSDCHRTTHYGLAQLRGQEPEVLAHLMAVTGMTRLQAEQHVAAAFDVWGRRSRHLWALDLRILTGAGIRVCPPPDATGRAEVARRTLGDLR
jgi:hypothetical protein